MTRLERFICKGNIYRGHYYKVLDNENIVWFNKFIDYVLNKESASLNTIMPHNSTELFIEIMRDKCP